MSDNLEREQHSAVGKSSTAETGTGTAAHRTKMEKVVKGLILASVSVIALGLGGAGTAHAWGYSGSAMGPAAPTYYPSYSSYSGYSPSPRYIPGNAAGTFDKAAAGGKMTGQTQPGQMPPPNAVAGQGAGAGGYNPSNSMSGGAAAPAPGNATAGEGMGAGGHNLPNNAGGGAAAPAAGNATGGQGMGSGAANPPSNTNSGAAAPQH